MIKYVAPFIVSFALSALFIAGAIRLAAKFDWKGRQSGRHIRSGKGKVFRVGGLAMILAFNAAVLLDRNLFLSPELYGVMVATILLMIVGIWDDFKEILWKIQLFFQVAIAIIVFIMGVRIYSVTNPIFGGIFDLGSGLGIVISAILMVFWITLVINSMNWLDGIDGLSGGITLIGALTIFFLSLKPEVSQPPVAILAMILAGSVLGFLAFNFNPSQVLAGTSGSMFMGFLLAVLAVFSGTKIATSLLVMALPIIDFVWVIGERIKNKKSIFQPDKNHLHHKLLELGWSPRKINAVFYLITAAISVVALNTRAIGKSITLVFIAAVMVAALAAINNRIKKTNYSQ
jgi:UDP-GlcNAc:undecaprenyl-phosphate/decaprenyl-phosphate GlcNAc-1-phosphate transferase